MIAIDVFPVDKTAVPTIYVYEPDTSENRMAISGKLSYRLRKEFGGHWTANSGRILSDKSVTEQQLNDFLRQLWKSNKAPLGNVRTIRRATGFGLNEYDIATFVAKAMLSDQNLQREITDRIDNLSLSRLMFYLYVQILRVFSVPNETIQVLLQ